MNLISQTIKATPQYSNIFALNMLQLLGVSTAELRQSDLRHLDVAPDARLLASLTNEHVLVPIIPIPPTRVIKKLIDTGLLVGAPSASMLSNYGIQGDQRPAARVMVLSTAEIAPAITTAGTDMPRLAALEQTREETGYDPVWFAEFIQIAPVLLTSNLWPYGDRVVCCANKHKGFAPTLQRVNDTQLIMGRLGLKTPREDTCIPSSVRW